MRNDLPSLAQIIEELADRVATQIAQKKPVAFESALEELIDYHRFILGLGASTTDNGAPFNYAEVAGQSWNAPHIEWLSQYRRLFERASDLIPENDHFLVLLAYQLGRLLRLPHDLAATPAMIDAVLNLFPIAMVAVEGWVTRRAVTIRGEGGEPAKQVLAGSDAKAHAATLRRLIGAWESMLDYAKPITELDRDPHRSPEQIWAVMRAAWPIAWRHIINTAYCLVLAVWNEDEEGASVMREALVRWPANIRHRLPDAAFLRIPQLLFPKVMELDWGDAQKCASELDFRHHPDPDPSALFAAVTRAAHADVVQLTAVVLSSWLLGGKRAGPMVVRAIQQLIGRVGAEGDMGFGLQPVTLESLLLQFLRFRMAGRYLEGGSYGARLDDLVRQLDGMTERDVVSGRTYTPSTMHDRSETIWSDVALLVAYADPGQAVPRFDEIRGWVEAEALLPHGDRTLRDLIAELDRYLEAIETNPPQIVETVRRLCDGQVEPRRVAFAGAVRAARAIISEHRARRLIERPIDPGKLDERRVAVEIALFDGAQERLWAAASIVRIVDPDAGQLCSYNWPSPKSRLTQPAMDVEVSNEVETIASCVANWALNRAAGVLLGGKADNLTLAVNPLDPKFWHALLPSTKIVGPRPSIFLPNQFRSEVLEAAFRPEKSPLAGVAITKRDGMPRDYICTIEDIDLFNGSTDDITAWLLSAEKLKEIRYSEFPDGAIVKVSWEPSNNSAQATEGKIVVAFRQSFEWREWPIVRIAPDDQANPAEDAAF